MSMKPIRLAPFRKALRNRWVLGLLALLTRLIVAGWRFLLWRAPICMILVRRRMIVGRLRGQAIIVCGCRIGAPVRC